MYTYTVVYTYIVMYSYGENGLPDAGNTRTLRHSATGVYREMDAYSVTETSYTMATENGTTTCTTTLW